MFFFGGGAGDGMLRVVPPDAGVAGEGRGGRGLPSCGGRGDVNECER